VKYSILIIEFYGIRKSRVSWWYLIGDGRKKSLCMRSCGDILMHRPYSHFICIQRSIGSFWKRENDIYRCYSAQNGWNKSPIFEARYK
jgi:hypothetical protein